MNCRPNELDCIATTEDAGRSVPSFGSDWNAAIAYGIDVTLLIANAKLPPTQRIRRLDELSRFAAEIQARTVSDTVRRALARRRLQEKLEALGPER